jgi:hypothetical protein
VTDPRFCHPQGPLVLPAHGAVHLGSGGVGLGRQSQECSGERPQRAGGRGFDGAGSLRGQSVAVVGPLAVGKRSALPATANTPFAGGSWCSVPLSLRMMGDGAGVRLLVPDFCLAHLRMVGVAADRFLQMVMVWLLPA